MRRVWRALFLIVVIAATTAALSWNTARVAPPPDPGGGRLVESYHAGWADLYVPAGRDTLPALLFSPGRGMEVSAYRHFLNDLASHGVIIIAVPYPPVRLEGNADYVDALRKIADAMAGTMDRIEDGDSLFRRVDPKRVGVAGHSFGGAAAATACADPRFKAAVDFDGSLYGRVVHEGVRCPFLLIERTLSGDDTSDAPIFYEERSQGRLHEDSLISHSRLVDWVTIDGLDHLSFTDPGLAFVSSNWVKETARLRLNAARSQRITADLTMDFLARHLGVKLDRARTGDPLPNGVHRVTKP